jgi:TolB-like protein
MALIEELKRRKVFRVAAAYAIVAWLAIQAASILLPTYGAPAWVMPVFTTVVMLGFPLALVLAWALEITPGGVRVTADTQPPRGALSGLTLNLFIMGVMALVIVALVVKLNVEAPTSELDAADLQAAAAAPTTSPAPANLLPNSIAVLPFANLSPDANNAYFAAGIHDTVLLELSKIRDMNVIARTSVLPYADTELPLAEIAATLRVENILEGSVQYAEGQVRITAQLINPSTGAHLWSGNYDRPFADVFAIQSEIASNIARAIGAELLPEELQQIGRRQTASEEAFALYLQARALEPNIAPNMAAPVRAALEQAIALDPDFAEPYAVLAFHYTLSLGNFHPELSNAEREDLGRRYALTALRLNPALGLAYGALAQIEGAHFRTQQEWDYWEQALALSPTDPDVLDDAIRSFAIKGNLERAQELATRIGAINPDARVTVELWLALGTGDTQGFLSYLEKNGIPSSLFGQAGEFFKTFQALFLVAEDKRERAAALMAEVNAAGVPPDVFFYPLQLYANGRVGNQLEAQAQYDAWVQRFGDASLQHINGAFLSLGIGDEAAALAIMRTLLAEAGPDRGNDSYFWELFLNQFKDPVLDKPEFMELRREFVARFGVNQD